MVFHVGDKIAVLDADVRGVVVHVTVAEIEIKDTSGMIFCYAPSELVKIGKDQNELAKYTDIDNPFLKSKTEEQPKNKSSFSKTKQEIILEVDLHINQLVKSTRNMDVYDMLNLQLDTAKMKIEYAIGKRMSKIVFIHGVGEGVLKSELQSLLRKYPVKYYDASYQKYGLGATEVYIFQNPN
jgi:dsDNA-specific endonuclease/ATPase MutS2